MRFPTFFFIQQWKSAFRSPKFVSKVPIPLSRFGNSAKTVAAVSLFWDVKPCLVNKPSAYDLQHMWLRTQYAGRKILPSVTV